ncbi:MAG: nickel pincer cofactor biosynthesis protein LarB [Lachnospiraceae bacterium]|nr:nickel pincer cofactor biosynthesis protein LarB [Lachnospiraceae bacterium]
MDNQDIYELLRQVSDGTRTPEQALNDIRMQPDMLVGNYADIDLHRSVRQGMPEVIYGEGKTAEQIVGILRAMTGRGVKNIMVTRLSEEKEEQVRAALKAQRVKISSPAVLPEGQGCNPTRAERVAIENRCAMDGAVENSAAKNNAADQQISLRYDPTSRIAIANPEETEKTGKVVVVAAGTSDLPVAEEAAITAELYGSHVERVYDVGVAGLHRLLHRLPVLEDANVIIAVAGMEGALVSVIGGLVACPVIGVPTSVGYGANFGGLAALLSMLNSCASGVSVVNIDNGFGAGVLAARINRQTVGK